MKSLWGFVVLLACAHSLSLPVFTTRPLARKRIHHARHAVVMSSRNDNDSSAEAIAKMRGAATEEELDAMST